MKLDHYLTPYTKINPKWIKHLNVRPGTIKLLEENISSNKLLDISLSDDFFKSDTKNNKSKKKKTRGTTSPEKLLHSRENHQQNERQPIKWEKRFANHISDKGLISKIYRELIQLNSKETTLLKKIDRGASLVAQWLGIRLPVQRTRVRALVWEDPTCRGATKPASHNY